MKKYSPTVFNMFSVLLIIFISIILLKGDMEKEGWLFVGIVIFTIVSISCLILDLFFQLTIKNKKTINIIEVVILCSLLLIFLI